MAVVRPIEFGQAPFVRFDEAPSPYEAGDSSTVEWIRLNDLYVDSRYQRPLAVQRAHQIAMSFNNAAVGLLFVNRRVDGVQAVYDGQTRLEAMRLKGHEAALCRVVHGLSPREEARAFVDCNKIRGAVAAIYLYHAELAFGDPASVAVAQVLEQRGIVVRDYTRLEDTSPVVAAVAALQHVARLRGVEILGNTLDVIQAAWPGFDRDAYTRDTIRAISSLLTLRSPQISVAWLIPILRTTTVAQLRARGHVLAEGTRWYSITALANAIVELCNRQLKPGVPPIPYLGRA